MKRSHTSERVAPPMMNTKIRWPIFFNSLDVRFNNESVTACLRVESLAKGIFRVRCNKCEIKLKAFYKKSWQLNGKFIF